MNRKKIAAAVLLLLALLMLSGCDSVESTYKQAQKLLSQNQYSQAAEKFTSLGGYEDSTHLAMYCNALAKAEAGEYELGLSVLASMGDFKDAPLRIQYYTAREIEDKAAAGSDFALMEQAVQQYRKNPLFLDSDARITALTTQIDEMKLALYTKAVEDAEAGAYEEAYAAFDRLGGYSDVDLRVKYYAIRKEEDGTVTPDSTEVPDNDAASTVYNYDALLQLSEKYAEIGDFLDSRERAAALKANAEAQMKQLYDSAVAAAEAGEYETAYTAFEQLGGYSDVDLRVKYYAIRMEEGGTIAPEGTEAPDGDAASPVYNYDALLLLSGKYAEMDDFLDSRERAAALKANAEAQMKQHYDEATAAGDAGNYEAAIAAFNALAVCGDSSSDHMAAYYTARKYEEMAVNGDFSMLWKAADAYASAGGILDSEERAARMKGMNAVRFAVSITPYNEQLYLVQKPGAKKDEKYYGLVDRSGNLILPVEYTRIDKISEGRALVRHKDGSYRYIDEGGHTLFDTVYDAAIPFSDGVAFVKKGGRYALIDSEGTLLSDYLWAQCNNYIYSFSSYDEDYPIFHNGVASVRNSAGQWGFIDASGKVVVEPAWDSVGRFSDGLALVCRDDKYGYIDMTGKVVGQPIWKDAYSFSDGLARVVADNGRYNFIDTTGKIVISGLSYSSVGDFHDGFAYAGSRGSYGYIDKTGSLYFSRQFEDADDFWYGAAITEIEVDVRNSYGTGTHKEDRSALINTDGKIVGGYRDIIERIKGSKGLYQGWNSSLGSSGYDSTYYLMNATSSQAFDYVSDSVNENGYIRCRTFNDTISYVSADGSQTLTEAQYNAKFTPSDDDAVDATVFKLYQENKLYGLKDSSGAIIAAPQWEEAKGCGNKQLMCVAVMDPYSGNLRYGLVNAAGEYVSEPQWDKRIYYRDSQAIVVKDNYLYCIDTEGRIVF